MNAKSLIIGLVALGLASLAVTLTNNWFEAAEGRLATAPREIIAVPNIMVARSNLPIGHIMEASDVTWMPWGGDSLIPGYLREDSSPLDLVLGKVVRHSMVKDEPVVTAKLVGLGEKGFVAATLSPGMRAVTIAVSRTSGVGGLIFPGDRVDIIVSHQIQDKQDITRLVSETVLQNIRVLAIDTRTNDQTNEPLLGKSVTIEVTSKVAEIIAVIQQLGTLSLSLRSLAIKTGSEQLSVARTHTFDAEVSSLLPPLELGRNEFKVSVSRGADTQNVDFRRNSK